MFLSCGATRNRTGDTRIFSPLLYHLSYGTIVFAGANVITFFELPKHEVKKVADLRLICFYAYSLVE